VLGLGYVCVTMNLTKSIQNYVMKILSDVQGMKVLLLDNETVSFFDGSLDRRLSFPWS
jgi:hypothetical protein